MATSVLEGIRAFNFATIVGLVKHIRVGKAGRNLGARGRVIERRCALEIKTCSMSSSSALVPRA
jgi:hypothetical protein